MFHPNRKKALREFKMLPTLETFINFKNQRAQIRRLVLQKKRGSWKKIHITHFPKFFSQGNLAENTERYL